MTDQEINMAIAEACGWTWEEPFNKRKQKNILCSPFGSGLGNCVVWRGGQLGGQEVPDYCHDLNAMHEAETVVWTEGWQAYAYIGHIKSMCGDEAIRATARQRAEAFLLTIGKWVEA